MQCGSREPIEFTPGDTLWFERYLPAYLPSNGWSLDYEIRGGAAVISFQSIPNAAQTAHIIKVLPAVTVLWLPGQMLMAGYAINTSGERHQIYLAELTLDKNLQGSSANVPVKTFKQILLEKMEQCVLTFTTSGLLETRIGETMFRYATPNDLWKAYGLAYQARANEIAVERAKNGQVPGNKIRPVARITLPGPLIGGYPSFPFGWGGGG